VERRAARVLVVGAGTRFLSGMSYYTLRLANALAEVFPVATIAMRQLMPTGLYPGASRVGTVTPALHHTPDVTVLPSVDWYWLPSLLHAVVGLARWKPDVVVFQWWTGTVLHTYLALALIARLRGAAVIVEFHEVLDTGEDRIPLARSYVQLVAPLFVGLASGFVIHSEADRGPLEDRYHLGRRPSAVVPHGPYDHHVQQSSPAVDGARIGRVAPPDAVNLLFFGVIRPFKGLEDLVEAFDGLPDDEIGGFWLTVVGETWEGWNLPIERIAVSRHRDRITLVNRYVDDAEVGTFFAAADAVVLPYRRSSASGPAHVSMSHGLPLVISLPSAGCRRQWQTTRVRSWSRRATRPNCVTRSGGSRRCGGGGSATHTRGPGAWTRTIASSSASGRPREAAWPPLTREVVPFPTTVRQDPPDGANCSNPSPASASRHRVSTRDQVGYTERATVTETGATLTQACIPVGRDVRPVSRPGAP
jgi:glycosyltransferase involved in cell wall biosynthesis